jgi:hypothetical protein
MSAESLRLPFTVAAATLAVTLSSCSCSASRRSGIEPERPDLTGTWLLDDLTSDDLRELLGGGNPADPGLLGGNRLLTEAMSNILVAARAFKIEQNDSTVAITLVNGRQFAFHHDGRWVERHVEGLGIVVARAQWKDGTLEVERRLDSRVRLTTTYALSDDGRRLFVKFKKSPPGRTIKLQRVYDAAPG